MQRDRRCTECGEPAAQGSRCLRHLVKARERQRVKRGLKRRYYNTLSYKLEAMAAPQHEMPRREAAPETAPHREHGELTRTE